MYATQRIKLKDFVTNTFWPNKKKLSHTTRACYRKYIQKYILPALGERFLDEIGYTEIQQMINGCGTEKIAKTAKDTLSSILGHASRDLHLIPYNPAVASFIYPDPRIFDEPFQGVVLKKWSQIWEWLEIVRKSEPGSLVERALLTSFLMGLRPSETCGLDILDFKLDKDQVRIIKAYTYADGKRELHDVKTPQARRDLPMLSYLKERFEKIAPDDGPWLAHEGKRVDPYSMSKRIRRFRDKHELPRVTLQTCRHSFATSSLRAGIDIGSVSKWLGHTHVNTTMRYCRISAEDLMEDACTLNELLHEEQGNSPILMPEALPADKLLILDKIAYALSYDKALPQELLERAA